MKKNLQLTALVLAACSLALGADVPAVKLTQETKSIKVEIGGELFTTYYFADGLGAPYTRPFFYPVKASDGTEVTADQVTTKGDHPHHRSLWVAHGEVNGADHWSLKGPAIPKQRHISFTKVEADSFVEELEWEGKDSEPMMKETRTARFFVYPDGARGVDLTIVFNPIVEKVTFGDTKEAGLCSVRVNKSIATTATRSNSTGAIGEPACWGKPAAWCDISGKVNEKVYGVAILDHPSNPRHPSTWHVRQYGLMGANIFGLSNFNKAIPKGAGAMTIEKGTATTFRYRVVIHTGDAKSANLDAKFKEFAEQK